MQIKVNYGKSVHGKDELKAVVDVIKNSTQMGKQTKNFENKISKLFCKKYGLMVNSGSSALLLAYEVLPIPRGSNIITPVLTFSTTVSSMVKAGYLPNFIDVNLQTYCIDEDKIEKNINKKTKAISIPNLLGNLPNWLLIKKIAKKYNLLIIEDSADALGSKINNISSGQHSDISITSFYGSHIINCAGNGGYLGFNNKKLYEHAKLLRSWGRSSSLYDENSEKIENRFNINIDGIQYDKKFVFAEQGYNFEPSEIGAAFGLIQLKKLKYNLQKRSSIFKKHNNFFSNFNDFFITPIQSNNVHTGWLAYPLLVKKNKYFNRTDLQIFLEKNKIQTRVVFTGNILRQPGFKNIKCIKNKQYNNADRVMKESLLIGCHHGLSNKEINYIHKKIEIFIKLKAK
ncbi:MAG: GDP-4-keto-6-deoxy-D-mannose-3-dehydratase / pyridoxamine-phosphate transaminase [Alphaproteobacteria bacterium MarineAlpha5_Bin5]|nr:MAG: GDP-4-keto-6-deoxy-D-mannose-3-dehydratase / pyridoxamine-phosphate transaminase [Alphaproteobacteria bacterium MarineAlpha5_Bin5]PPR52839.1 MAG: GDP-4-keto-6-deoxy-D-mannose-3-dehydratase / pyridoxamine-phosphate transaminase [Alphaproteobacteria bacterium MarineAlpha5_Bin4]|tara:strand:- start:1092 stop:2291 length:1200 start_codon:yes stop_codon:yes gene_type:complete